WSQALGAPPASARCIAFRSRDLRQAVWAAFATSGDPPTGWACHVSPDVMIDAASVDAIARGEYRLVLGEAHPFNTLTQSALMSQCADRATLIEWLDRDCPGPRVMWTSPKKVTPQRVQYFARPGDFV